jgi:hypothetical protein
MMTVLDIVAFVLVLGSALSSSWVEEVAAVHVKCVQALNCSLEKKQEVSFQPHSLTTPSLFRVWKFTMPRLKRFPMVS